MRAFVAVLLSPELRAALARLPRRTPPRGIRVKWVDEPNLHVTLEFLGEVAEVRVASVVSALHAASETVRAFDLAIRGLGQFPPRGSPRVLWVGADGGPELSLLHERVERGLEREGFPLESRSFHAHVTLARVDGFLREPELSAMWSADPTVAFGTVRITSFSLMESRLGPSGPAYREIERIPLSDG